MVKTFDNPIHDPMTIIRRYSVFIAMVSIGFAFIFCAKNEDDPTPDLVTPENALQKYLEKNDIYSWELRSSYPLIGVTAYDLLLTSQQWRAYSWTHQLTILVPEQLQYDGALLWITGGSLQNGVVKWTAENDGETLILSLLAARNQAVVAILRQTPNQPLYNNLSEDALISYTLNEFRNDRDFTWPLLFPMVKSAIKAMDAVQEFSKVTLAKEVDRFLVAGASKRGWTTWLTGASDPRVEAIAPAVIDMLNMPVSLDYQLKVWGDYSEQIRDYVDLGIPQDIHSVDGNTIATMIDPYAYRDKLTMPKMIFIGTNDPYWPVDAIKHYIQEIPGENFIHYVPNAGHDLGGAEQTFWAISAFFRHTITYSAYPVCSWEISENGNGMKLEVQATANALVEAYLWSADSEDRDFRDEQWNKLPLHAGGVHQISTDVDYPASGFSAFYVDLEYNDPFGSTYTKSTRMFVCDVDELLLN